MDVSSPENEHSGKGLAQGDRGIEDIKKRMAPDVVDLLQLLWPSGESLDGRQKALLAAVHECQHSLAVPGFKVGATAV